MPLIDETRVAPDEMLAVVEPLGGQLSGIALECC